MFWKNGPKDVHALLEHAMEKSLEGTIAKVLTRGDRLRPKLAKRLAFKQREVYKESVLPILLMPFVQLP